jgi:pimeloyl-ACP methyl ester carboxylesterase
MKASTIPEERTVTKLYPLALLALCTACDPKDDTADDTAVVSTVPDLPTGGCDMVAYDWVPTDQVGAVVDADEGDDLEIGAAAIDFLLASYGITQFSPLGYDVRGWRIRYVTQDKGQPVEATMVLTLPDVDDGESFPIVVWPHGTSGFNDACAPSAGGMEESGFSLIFSSMGYAVVAPDYLGMNGFGDPSGMLHPYMVPEATAVATLDAVRAALNFVADEQPGATMDVDKTVFWGGSEGGFAALWAERYQPQYLPEVTTVATLALVPPTDLSAIAMAGLSEPIDASGGLVAAFVGEHSWYQAPGHDLSEVLLDPIAEALPQEMMESCNDFPSIDGATTLEELFQPELLAQATTGGLEGFDPWACYLGMADLEDTLIPRTIDPPVLVQVSGADELVVASTVRDSIAGLCDDGYRIDYIECEGADHTEGAINSLPYQIEWVAERLAGTPLPESEVCVVDAPIECEDFIDD